MSKILVDELVNLVGTDKVTFSEGLKISNGETIDLNGATITLDTGVGLNDQLLASTGSGLKWVTFSDTNSTYAFASVNAAVNDVKLNLTGGGDAAGQLNQVTMTGSGSVSLTENAGVITVTGTDTNTTYDLLFSDITNGANVELTDSNGGTDTLILKGGSNIDITRNNNEVTISTQLSGTVGAPSTTTDNAIPLFDGTDGTLLSNSTLVVDASSNLTGVNSITTATQTASKIPFWYDQQGSFPSATTYEGALAFNDSDSQMYYAAGNSWYRIARYDDIQLDTNTTYSFGFNGGSTLTLLASDGITDTVSFSVNPYSDIRLYTVGQDDLHISNRKYSTSAVSDAAGAILRLTATHYDDNGGVYGTPVNDDITFRGADGLTVEWTDNSTITFRQGGGTGGTSYTDNDAKDAAAQALVNGTQLGIAFTYDSTNKVINAQVGTTPTTFNFTTGADSLNQNYEVTGSDRGNTYSAALDPTITVYEGDTIIFDNTNTRVNHPMYIRVSDGGASVSNPVASGEGTATVSWTPTTAGTYYYQCGNHSGMIGTITVLSTGGGGGGSAILYDLYGTNTTSNNVIFNLDPSTGNTDQIELVGGGGTSISWDSVNNAATISSTAPVQSDWDATSGLAQILNKPTIPPAYTLPAATTSTLGGVIPDGTTITVDANGNIAAAPGGYVLPTASSTVLGGIKIGAGLSIDAGGVVTVSAGGSVGLQTRQDLSGTTSSLADNDTENLNITAYKAYTLLKIETDVDAWVRIYTDAAARTADATRSEGNDPAPGSGVIAETRGSGVVRLSPGIIGYNNDSPSATDTVYAAVTNRSGSASQITVTLTAIRLEA